MAKSVMLIDHQSQGRKYKEWRSPPLACIRYVNPWRVDDVLTRCTKYHRINVTHLPGASILLNKFGGNIILIVAQIQRYL